MLKHPTSAFVRLIPAFLWLGLAVLGVVFFFDLADVTPKSGVERRLIDELFPYGFLVLALFGLRNAYKAYSDVRADLRADQPIRIPSPSERVPPPYVPTRIPMSPALRENVRALVSRAEEAGLLRSGEISTDEIIACAEMLDEFDSFEFGELMHVLDSLNSRRKPRLANLAFSTIQVEVDESYIAEMVTEAARLADAPHRLSGIRLRSIDNEPIRPARRSEYPELNAVVDFSGSSVPVYSY